MGKFSSILRSAGLILTVGTVMVFVQGVAKADQVTVAGYTNSCFGPCAAPNSSVQQTASVLGLTFNNSQFNGTTSNGAFAVANSNVTTLGQNVNNLGSFTLNGSTNGFTGQSFSLRVSFTLPPGINGSNSTLYTATLTGSVFNNNNGVVIDFNNTPTLFTFTFQNAQGQTVSGAFNFSINDVSVGVGQTIALSGNITGAQQQIAAAVPEPTSIFLFSTGLVGAAGMIRRRLRR